MYPWSTHDNISYKSNQRDKAVQDELVLLMSTNNISAVCLLNVLILLMLLYVLTPYILDNVNLLACLISIYVIRSF